MATILKIAGGIVGLIVLFLLIGLIDVFLEDFNPSGTVKIIIIAVIFIAYMVYKLKNPDSEDSE